MEQAFGGGTASCSYAHSLERSFCRGAVFSDRAPVQRRIPHGRSHYRGAQLSVKQLRSQRSLSVVVRADGSWLPPPVSDTKHKFYEGFKKPIPGVYNTVIQELLVQQHLMRYNKNYSYDEVFALGLVSVFDQVVDGIPQDAQPIFQAYITALGEEPGKYRSDADKLAEWAKGLSGAADIKPDAQGNDSQKLLASIADRAKDGTFLYTKFFAIGLFRLLELTGAKEPQALGNLVKTMNVQQDSVNRDLMQYKGVLSKLSAAKELMQEFMEREKKKQAEREAEKKAKAESESQPAVAADAEKASA